MQLIHSVVDFILHIDTHLQEIISQYGTITYAILFAIVFIETGLVVMPFLPGDSLLFAAGAFAAIGSLNVWIVLIVFALAAVIGDTVNYHIGKFLGPKVFTQNRWFLNREKLMIAEAFYEKHGGKAILFARFVPFVRTFAPFVAGIGRMKYGNFLFWNILGGSLWVLIFTGAGYFFGNIPAVKENFTLVIFGIIFVSILPPIYHWAKTKFFKSKTGTTL